MVLCECSHSFELLSVLMDSQFQMYFLYIPLKFFFPFLSFPFSESKLCCYGLVSGFIRVMKYWNYSELCNQSYSIYNRVRAELTRYSLLSYQKLQNRPVVRVLHNGNNHTDTIESLILFGTSVSLNSPGLLFSVLFP